MISLFVENGIAYVWNAEDWFTLRSEHRICGALVGSLPSFPRQNDFMGLPMALMYEEAVLLVKRGICELYELPNISIKPNEEEKQEVKAMEERILTEQTEALKKRRIEQIAQKIDIIVAGKRQKLLSKGVSDSNLNKETLLQEEIDKLPALLPAHVLLHLPTQHHIDTEKKKVSVDAINSSASRDDQSHFLIFNYLWEQGHHITSGSKFGCHYLLYPGDPVKFHAMYMVRCVKDASTAFRPINLISFGRLAVAVNKIAILAFCNDHGQVQCQTLQWHDNFS
ncbi:tRNA splicing endonuclease subunit 34 [Choristoneura fumiferana]|uniref:tRNA splicing endonuclease subunit 34 n=1 Tax=Choristoneura fumiferana TaxID=7141 RepID=UPI003D159B48